MIALLYHDVVSAARAATSGFGGADADHYKLDPLVFAAHARHAVGRDRDVRFTFDDGGASALEPTADILESVGHRGHFFIPTDYIARPGFLDRAQLRSLADRGHEIGTHSASHPVPIHTLPDAEIEREWVTSRQVLEDLLGRPVTSGSVPGGFNAPVVEAAARRAGLTVLFTSEPAPRPVERGGLTVVGRFSVTRATSEATIAEVIRGGSAPWRKQAALWEAKALAKRLGGRHWLALRRLVFRWRAAE
ncbi:MAG: polysaccharide deacetylase family protein [Gemmatimonadetes bacterium]|nr:polysaccharide deacetylase family protein [Gemmatimonadota bacterium]